MVYGLKITNADLKIIIDENYSNYALYESGSLTLTYDGGNIPNFLTGTATFSTAAPVPPLIAIKPDSSYHAGLKRYIKSGANYTGFELGGDIAKQANLTIYWMAFIPVSGHESAETYGLKVKDSSGNVTFDSGRKYLKILNVLSSTLTYSSMTTTPNTDNLNHTAGTHYFITSPYGLINNVIDFDAQGPYTFFAPRVVGVKYVNSTTVSFGETFFYENGVMDDIRSAFPYGFWPSNWKILVVKDVT